MTPNDAASASFAYDDLREWLREAERLGELEVVRNASWQKEIGLATELLNHSETAPCVLFDDIPGCPKGFRLLVNFFGGRRTRMTLGFPTHLSKLALSDAFLQVLLKDRKTLPAQMVDTGPVFENILTGDQIDLLKFPTPLWHAEDGGRYIGTGSYNVTKDPDEDWVNIGTYRVMIHDRNSVGFYISPGKHGRIHRDKYIARGQKMPVVMVLGGDPLTFLAASTESPYGVPEYDIVGQYRGRPMQLVRGKITGLPFPANAELVLEGFMDPNDKRPEGPFGEWTGYYSSRTTDEPVMTVEAIYHRDNPIMLGCPPQRPPDEIARYRAITRSALFRENIDKAGVPGVTAVWAHEVGNTRMLIGVAIQQRYPGHSRQAGHVAAMCHVGAYAGKYVVIVDDDIDVSNLEELMWAMVTRSDPETSIDIIRGAWSTPLDPRIPPEKRERKDFTNSRAVVDACRPFHWRDQFAKVNLPSAADARLAEEKFGYLLKRRSQD
jgi:4-hydroxy-3-polyprenylbenzoate decarboxylase